MVAVRDVRLVGLLESTMVEPMAGMKAVHLVLKVSTLAASKAALWDDKKVDEKAVQWAVLTVELTVCCVVASSVETKAAPVVVGTAALMVDPGHKRLRKRQLHHTLNHDYDLLTEG